MFDATAIAELSSRALDVARQGADAGDNQIYGPLTNLEYAKQQFDAGEISRSEARALLSPEEVRIFSFSEAYGVSLEEAQSVFQSTFGGTLIAPDFPGVTSDFPGAFEEINRQKVELNKQKAEFVPF